MKLSFCLLQIKFGKKTVIFKEVICSLWFFQEHTMPALCYLFSCFFTVTVWLHSDMTNFCCCNLLPLLLTFASRHYSIQWIWYLVGVLNGCNLLREQVEMRVVAGKVTKKEAQNGASPAACARSFPTQGTVTRGISHSRGAQFEVKPATLTTNLLNSETQCKIYPVVVHGRPYIEEAHQCHHWAGSGQYLGPTKTLQ